MPDCNNALVTASMPSPRNSMPCPRRNDWTSLLNERSATAGSSVRDERQYAQRTPRAVDDLQRRGNDHRTGGRQLIEIGQARDPEAIRAVHDRVAGEHRLERRSLAGIRADRLDAHAENIALPGEERHRLRMEAGSVRPVRRDVEKLARALAL